MVSRWILAVLAVLSISLPTFGFATAVVCNPICAPVPSSGTNSGINQALSVANPNGVSNGLATAQTQPGGTTGGPCSGC